MPASIASARRPASILQQVIQASGMPRQGNSGMPRRRHSTMRAGRPEAVAGTQVRVDVYAGAGRSVQGTVVPSRAPGPHQVV